MCRPLREELCHNSACKFRVRESEAQTQDLVKIKKAAKKMGVDISEMAMLGDQLFADVKAANKCGAIAVRIDPMKGETRFPRYYAKRRAKEAPILAEFEKTHGYGVKAK